MHVHKGRQLSVELEMVTRYSKFPKNGPPLLVPGDSRLLFRAWGQK